MIGMRRFYNLAEGISALRPNSQWAMRDNDISQLSWYSTDSDPPTLEEIQAKIVELEADEPMRVLREIRDWYLQNSDWTQMQDLRALRGAEWCAAWDTYRQQLRDFPSSDITPYFDDMNVIQGVTWPAAPEST
jgi:hypothetical protein